MPRGARKSRVGCWRPTRLRRIFGCCFLAAHSDVAASGDDNLYTVATARPGVGANLPTQESALPTNGGRFGAAARYTDANILRAAAAGWVDTKRGVNGRRAAATRVACVPIGGGRDQGASCHCHDGQHGSNSEHFWCPPSQNGNTCAAPSVCRRPQRDNYLLYCRMLATEF